VPRPSVRPDGGAAQAERIARILATFERLAQAASVTHTDDLLAIDITMQQAKALHVIAAEPGIGVTALAGRLGIGPSTTSASVDRLAEMGLLERRHDDVDRRHVALTLTDDGRAVMDRFRDHGVAVLGRYLPHLRPAELAGLQTALDGLLRAMGAQQALPPPIGVEGANGTS
jgi:DNA-binding MarR family transcriptional regulator